MTRILIMGNSGSGKSTLARRLADDHQLVHLDLDTLAWLPSTPPTRAPLDVARVKIDEFTTTHTHWVIEGCYRDLLELLKDKASLLLWNRLPIEDCVVNAKSRPWEPHKYDSKDAQDENLEMLINWIRQYNSRDDEFSEAAHLAFYHDFSADKQALFSNDESKAFDL